jgi:transcriptional regulator with XRE-family HTH domain
VKLGELVGLAREIKGMTIRDVERESGVSNAVISQIETGHIKEPSFLKVVRICEALGLPLDRAAACVSLKGLKSILRKPSH